jgi:hypothetical protein
VAPLLSHLTSSATGVRCGPRAMCAQARRIALARQVDEPGPLALGRDSLPLSSAHSHDLTCSIRVLTVFPSPPSGEDREEAWSRFLSSTSSVFASLALVSSVATRIGVYWVRRSSSRWTACRAAARWHGSRPGAVRRLSGGHLSGDLNTPESLASTNGRNPECSPRRPALRRRRYPQCFGVPTDRSAASAGRTEGPARDLRQLSKTNELARADRAKQMNLRGLSRE